MEKSIFGILATSIFFGTILTYFEPNLTVGLFLAIAIVSINEGVNSLTKSIVNSLKVNTFKGLMFSVLKLASMILGFYIFAQMIPNEISISSFVILNVSTTMLLNFLFSHIGMTRTSLTNVVLLLMSLVISVNLVGNVPSVFYLIFAVVFGLVISFFLDRKSEAIGRTED